MARITVPLPPSEWGAEFQGMSITTRLSVDVDVSGIEQIKRNARLLTSDMVKAAHEEALRMAEWLFNASEKLVPYLTGYLHDSEFIHVDEDDPVTGITVGYDSLNVPYAWYVHEVPARTYTKQGTQHHYLSDPADELKAEFPDQMRRGIVDAIKRSAAITGAPRLIKKH